MDELIICVAPVPGEAQHEKFEGRMDVPQEILRSFNAGAAIAHLHVRDPEGRQVADPTHFQSTVEAIRKSCPIIIEGSTGGTPDHTLEQRSSALRVAGIEMGSLNMGSINMHGGVYQNPISEIRYYALEMKNRGVKPFFVIFDLSMLYNVRRLEAEGLLSQPFAYNFVFDAPDCLPFSEEALSLYLKLIPETSFWIITRYHARGWKDFRTALERGGHVRVGYEDSPFLSSGKKAGSNAELVHEVVQAARMYGRPVADTSRARQILGLKQ